MPRRPEATSLRSMMGQMRAEPPAETIAEPMSPIAMSRSRAAGNAMASEPEPGVDYEDFHGAGGWGYRFYPDGTIKIIYAPEGHKAGAKLSGGPAYDAIMAEYEASQPAPEEPAPESTHTPVAERLRQGAELGDVFAESEQEPTPPPGESQQEYTKGERLGETELYGESEQPPDVNRLKALLRGRQVPTA